MKEESCVLSGAVVTKPIKAYEDRYGNRYYMFYLSIMRRSRVFDDIRVFVNEKFLYTVPDIGGRCEVYGYVHTYNKRSHLIVGIRASRIVRARSNDEDLNSVEQVGKLDKLSSKLIFTKDGKVVIRFMLKNCKTQYLPCIAWGSLAYLISRTNNDTEMTIKGRIQSKEITENGRNKIVYEVSCFDIKLKGDKK